jgi:hypothetical protein
MLEGGNRRLPAREREELPGNAQRGGGSDTWRCRPGSAAGVTVATSSLKPRFQP